MDYRKRIGIIVPSLSKAGAEKVASQLSLFLNEDYEIHYILFNDFVDYDYKGKKHILSKGINNKLKRTYSYFKNIKKIKKRESFDYVISFLELPNILNILTKTQKEKTIISVRNFISIEYDNYRAGKILKLLVKILYNRADKVVSVSKEIENDLIHNFKIKEELLSTIYNPINLEYISEKRKESVNEILEWKEDSILFANVGRLEYQKNHEDFIKIISDLIKRNINVKGIIIGSGSKMQDLKKLIFDLEIEDSIRLVGHQTNPYKYLNISDIYLMTSFYEGFPNALIEGIAAENYIISSNCKSGPSEILETRLERNPTNYGMLISDLYSSKVTNEDIKAIEEVIKNDTLREEAIVNSKKKIDDFSYDNIKKKWINLLKSW